MLWFKGGGRPGRRGETVMMRADNDNAVAWVKMCSVEDRTNARVGALMRMMGALDRRKGGVF